MGAHGWDCCTPFFRCCPFAFPVQPQSTELPATTEGSWRRRHLSPGHKAGLLTVLLTCTGCVFQVTPGVEKGVTLKKATNPRTGGYHTKNWAHVSDTLAVRFNLVYGILVLFGASCLGACRFFSVLRPQATSPQCVSAACTATSCHLEGRRESSMVCALLSLTPLHGVQLLPRQFDESSNSHCSVQPISISIGQAQ